MRKTTSNSDKPVRRRDLVWSTCKCWTILATVGLLLTNHMLGSGLFSATLLKSWRSVEGGKIGNLEHGNVAEHVLNTAQRKLEKNLPV